jgi:subtilisin-like proprotein convertase family protein
LKNHCFQILTLILWPVLLSAQSLWQPAPLPRIDSWAEDGPLPLQYKSYALNQDMLLALLADAPLRFDGQNGTPVSISLPLPNGEFETFRIWHSPVMQTGLASKYPDIHTWFGYNPDQPAHWVHMDLGPRGFHALITAPGADPIYIDPFDRLEGSGPYLIYHKSDFAHPQKDPFDCLTQDIKEKYKEAEEQSGERSDGTLRTYRLALACTGEYGAFHGSTKTQVLAAMATTLNRINGIYEREFGLRMELVADNDKIIYLNGATDPFTNDDISSLLGENQDECDAKIGPANYDVGHVFGTGGGGLATLNSPCNNNSKARAATGLSSPIGDPFDIDYVAHEFGHQFGCNHTFNNSCSGNRNNATAWEPGSGSTIMSYSGICAPNVKNASDAFFHGGNLLETRNFTVNGNGNTCPEKLVTGNQLPQVSAGLNYTIPRSTPFELEASASDPDGDALTYSWEQYDNQIATMPPVNTNGTGPTFRSFPPDTVPVRVFPNLMAVLGGTSPTWEVLPSVARLLNFRVTVRDNHPGHGLWAQDAMQITVDGSSGPFTVTAPNTAVTWRVGDTVSVTWNRANTHVAPVSADRVDIWLSLDGGYHYPVLLASGVPNNGTSSVVVPFKLSNSCRIKVKGHGNVFFDVSNTNFSIKEPVSPSFLASGLEDTLRYCNTGSDTLTVHVALQPLNNFTAPITLMLQAPAGLQTNLQSNWTLTGTDTITFQIWGMGDLNPGEDQFKLVLTAPGVIRTLSYSLSGFGPLAALPDAVFPLDNTDSVGFQFLLQWSPVTDADDYVLELATSPAFGASLVMSQTTRDTFVPVALEPSTRYYWRVSPRNVCGIQPARRVWVFRTILEECADYTPAILPIDIPADEAFITNSIIPVAGPGKVSAVRVDVDLTHAKLEDITLRLLHPSGNARSVYAKSCVDGEDIIATFADDGDEFTCSGQQPAVSGTIKPATGLFTNLIGQQVAGNWALRIIDDFPQGGGVLNSWSLNVCKHLPPPPTPMLAHLDTLDGSYCQSVVLSNMELGLTDTLTGSIELILREAPAHGQLQLAGISLQAGDIFTMADIENEQITYRHDGSLLWSDSMLIDGYNSTSKGWLPGHWVQVRVTPQLTASVSLLSEVLCPGDTTASVAVLINSCRPPYSYRLLPNDPWQAEDLFENLPAGIYTFEARDSNGFTAQSMPFEIFDPEPLSVGTFLKGDTLTLNGIGGKGPYHYALGADTSSTGAFVLEVSGSYEVTVTDGNGCVYTTTLMLELLDATTSTGPISCNGEATGAILIMARGGVPPYLYQLNGGAWQTDSVFVGLPAGAYDLAVQDGSGAMRDLGTIVLEESEALQLMASQLQDSIAVLVATGGTPPYQYQLGEGMFQSEPTFGSLGKGTYVFLVEDINGCQDSTTLTIVSSAIGDMGAEVLSVGVYPNPSDGQFIVAIGGPDQEQWRWSIRDVLGRERASGRGQGATWRIDQPGMAAGMYYLRLESSRYLRVLPILVE